MFGLNRAGGSSLGMGHLNMLLALGGSFRGGRAAGTVSKVGHLLFVITCSSTSRIKVRSSILPSSWNCFGISKHWTMNGLLWSDASLGFKLQNLTLVENIGTTSLTSKIPVGFTSKAPKESVEVVNLQAFNLETVSTRASVFLIDRVHSVLRTFGHNYGSS